MSVFPSNLQWLGMAKETVSGTPAAAPTIWVPLIDPAWTPNQMMLADEALRGNMADEQTQVAGPRVDMLTFKTYPYLDVLFPLMMNVLGAPDTVTGSADPWTHKTALLSTGSAQPSTWTLWPFNGAETWRMAGCTQDSVEIDVKADELVGVDSSWIGQPATQVVSPTNTPTSQRPWASWNTTVTVGGAGVTSYTDVKLSYKRATEVIHTADGSQGPYAIYVGPLAVEGDFTGVYQGVAGAPTDLTTYLTNVIQAFTVQVKPVGDATHSGTWQHTTCGYRDVKVTGGGGKYVEISGKVKAFPNATDTLGANGASQVQFTLLNAVSTAY